MLKGQVAFELPLHVGSGFERQLHTEARNALQEKNALNDALSVLHFVNGLLLDERAQLAVSPGLLHLGVQEILADGDEFCSQNIIQMRNYLVVTPHSRSFKYVLII